MLQPNDASSPNDRRVADEPRPARRLMGSRSRGRGIISTSVARKAGGELGRYFERLLRNSDRKGGGPQQRVRRLFLEQSSRRTRLGATQPWRSPNFARRRSSACGVSASLRRPGFSLSSVQQASSARRLEPSEDFFAGSMRPIAARSSGCSQRPPRSCAHNCST